MTDDPYSRLQYRRLIAWPERIRREWPFLERRLSEGPSQRLLDLGCGTGEHSRFLASHGFEVLGIDRSESMLAAAREGEAPAGVRFLERDLAALADPVEGLFGGAICLGNTLPHLTTVEALSGFLGGLRGWLLDGAPFILQLLNYTRIFERGERHLPLSFRRHGDGESVFLRLMDLHPDGRVTFLPTTLLLRPEADPPLTVEASKRVDLRGWRYEELESSLAGAGFGERIAYGAFDGSPFEPSESRDLILVAA